MPRKPLESLGVVVRDRRGGRKLRETAREIGVSPATLMRVESGRIPDVETFGKLCKWLGEDPAVFLGIEKAPRLGSTTSGLVPILSLSAHFKADQTPKPETVQALAQMVLHAVKTQSREEDPEQ